jgi:hypothetical protein
MQLSRGFWLPVTSEILADVVRVFVCSNQKFQICRILVGQHHSKSSAMAHETTTQSTPFFFLHQTVFGNFVFVLAMNDQKAREMLGANDCCIYRIWFVHIPIMFVASAAAKTMVNVVSKCCLGLFYCVFSSFGFMFFSDCRMYSISCCRCSFVVKNIVVVVVAVAAVAIVVVVFVVCCLLFNVCCLMFLV